MDSGRASGAGQLRALVTFALLIGALVALLPSAASAAGVVPTDKGPVRGTETAAVKEYLGIPYAAPPVGNLRWRAPRPHPRWQTARATPPTSRTTARSRDPRSAARRPTRTACT